MSKEKKETIREILIDAIVANSSDELDVKDYIEIAKESDKELAHRLVNILNWYANNLLNT